MKHFALLVALIALLNSCVADDALPRVDAALRGADAAAVRAMEAADSCARDARALPEPGRRFDGLLDAAGMYASLDLEKSLQYIREAEVLAAETDCGPDATTIARLRLASLYNSQAAMVKDAADIFASLDPARMGDRARRQYYILGVQLNRSLAESAFDPTLSQRYRRLASAYRDSVVGFGGGSAIIAANRLAENGRLEEATRTLLAELPDSASYERRYGPIYHILAGIYRRRGMHAEELDALAAASVCDLRAGVRDYRALPELALALLAEGDVSRAHTYIHRSALDAAACHASKRQSEIGAAMQAIDAAYAQHQSRSTHTWALVGIAAIIFAAAIGWSLLLLRRRNRRLRESTMRLIEARAELERTNASVSALNDSLRQESRAKEMYIRAFMELCLSYLRKMESYRAELGKIAAQADWVRLTRTISSSRYVNREVEQFFREFDSAFLQLYPDFIGRINSLLRPGERYAPTDTLTTELRIYALLRLGVRNSGEIARFLRCSESTVYNYRTQMRNRALDRTAFEADFLAGALD